jgi:hypothetical protein
MHSEGVSAQAVTRWHTLLRAAACLNIVIWSCAAAAVVSERAPAACYLQLLLSAAYVLGCAFRCAMPVFDIPRLVLVDSRVSSVLVGRSVATVAELCFAAQWALLLYHAALMYGSPTGQAIALVMVPLIVLAEACSWHAVLTTAQSGHVVENSIWGLAALLLIGGMFATGTYRVTAVQPVALAWCVGGIAYTVFIFIFDVPMYWRRWRADQADGRRYLTLSQGLRDVQRRWTVSYRWADWKDEVLWMSLYFTFGVWSSISLIYACVALEGR